MVKRVEHLQAELKAARFAEVPPLLNAHVPICVMWRAKVVKGARSISKTKWTGLYESGTVDPVSDALMVRFRITNYIRALVHIKCAQGVVLRPNAKGEAAFCSENSGQLPPTENLVHWTAPAVSNFFSFANREFVNVIDNQAVGNVADIPGPFSSEVGEITNIAAIAGECPA